MYIVFEGNNNTGKSTQIGRVKGLLDEIFKIYDKQHPHINIFHEGDTCKKSYDNWYEAVLDYARDRAGLQHLIKSGEYSDITLADRSYYSSLVYQGKGDKQCTEYVRCVNSFAEEPDLIFLFENEDDTTGRTELYKDVIPYSKYCSISTSGKEIQDTTFEIVEIIFNAWLKLYDDSGADVWNLVRELSQQFME